AIDVRYVTTFSGGILNAAGGSISAFVSAIYLNGDSIVSGGIVNAGTILARSGSGIDVYDVSTFAGAITNSGSISATAGINLVSDNSIGTSDSSGGIVNTGAITASV